jgi:hypothetical protein
MVPPGTRTQHIHRPDGRVTNVPVTVRSTTGTQPLTFTRISADRVQITDQFGATQIYWVADILNAVKDDNQENQ